MGAVSLVPWQYELRSEWTWISQSGGTLTKPVKQRGNVPSSARRGRCRITERTKAARGTIDAVAALRELTGRNEGEIDELLKKKKKKSP